MCRNLKPQLLLTGRQKRSKHDSHSGIQGILLRNQDDSLSGRSRDVFFAAHFPCSWRATLRQDRKYCQCRDGSQIARCAQDSCYVLMVAARIEVRLALSERTVQNPGQSADSVPECAEPSGQQIPPVNIPPQPADAASCLCTKT